MKDSISNKSLFTRIRTAINTKDYVTASALQVEMHNQIKNLKDIYAKYKQNLF